MKVTLYGRNPDVQRTTFDYPQSVFPFSKTARERTFLTLPAAANRIFGNPDLRMLDGDDVTVQLDPTSTYEYTGRWKGIGGLGDTASIKVPFKDKHELIYKADTTIIDLMRDNPAMSGLVLLCAAAAFIGGERIIAKFF